MARTWLSVTVELLGGRGDDLWPWPGRIFAVGPSHTFTHLADAINDAFARWDRSHLSMFTLSDGQVITDSATGADMAEMAGGPIVVPLDIDSTKVARTVQPGAEFQFTFDLGDNWTHRCVVGTEKVDPMETLGIRPKTPLPYWGWGSIPDQYGRRWSDDDGESKIPPRPRSRHPMLLHAWPAPDEMPALDPAEVRTTIAAGDADRFLAAVCGRDVDDALQQVGAGIPLALEHRRSDSESVALSIINRLAWRAGPGDTALADDLLAHLRNEPLTGHVLPVDLDMLSTARESDSDMSTDGYLDLHSGEVVGADATVDVEAEPERWLRFENIDARDGWNDMVAFAGRQRDTALRERLERAGEGTGAFRRFRDLVDAKGLTARWSLFRTDRQLGRAREFLADNGIRVG